MPLPHPTTDRQPTTPARTVTAVLLLLACVALFASHSGRLLALEKMAGRSTGDSAFASAQKYLDGLRDALIPLAIPLASIGLLGGGVAYMVGNAMAQRILGGVVFGLALCLLGPSLIA
jgi:hypothetical protein